jgi:hypothetical protein
LSKAISDGSQQLSGIDEMTKLDRFETRYRSLGLPAGCFRRLGSVHVHVDGGGEYEVVRALIRELENEGRGSKLTTVARSVAGPERKEHPETYASHTPPGGDRALEYFSTSAIPDRADGVQLLGRVLARFAERSGTVIEVERVVATVEDSTWSQVAVEDFQPFLAEEVGFKGNATLPFEIHHAFDIPNDAASQINVKQVLSDTTKLGLVVGGWFNFARTQGDQSFRSNAFGQRRGIRERVLSEQKLLAAYLATKHAPVRLWTIVEQVLGIWRTPLQKVST